MNTRYRIEAMSYLVVDERLVDAFSVVVERLELDRLVVSRVCREPQELRLVGSAVLEGLVGVADLGDTQDDLAKCWRC